MSHSAVLVPPPPPKGSVLKDEAKGRFTHQIFIFFQVTFLMMPTEIGWQSTVQWKAGDALCRFFAFFRIFGLFLSSNILICISLDRSDIEFSSVKSGVGDLLGSSHEKTKNKKTNLRT